MEENAKDISGKENYKLNKTQKSQANNLLGGGESLKPYPQMTYSVW